MLYIRAGPRLAATVIHCVSANPTSDKADDVSTARDIFLAYESRARARHVQAGVRPQRSKLAAQLDATSHDSHTTAYRLLMTFSSMFNLQVICLA